MDAQMYRLSRKRMRKGTRPKLLVVIAAVLVAALLMALSAVVITGCSTSSTAQAKSNQFAVMSTTDMHGKVWDTDLLTGETADSNFLKVHSAVKETKNAFGDRTVLFDNGDLYQGTDMASSALKASVFEKYHYISPATYCLQFCQYDGYTLGNHEFNYNWQVMSNTYQYLDCAGIPCVCANIYDQTTGQRIFKPYMTKTLNIDGSNFTVGIIGLENTDCPKWDSSSHYPNMIFHSPENPNADQAYEIQKVQKEMEQAGVHCDFLIVSMHSGFVKEGAKADKSVEEYFAEFEKQAQEPLVYLTNTENQTYRTIKNSTGVDMFITGHDHVSYFSNQKVKNNAGQDVLMVSGGGKDLTKSVFSVNKDPNTGKFTVTQDSSENLDLSKYENSQDIVGVLQASKDRSENYINQYICKFEENWDNNNSYSTSDYFLKQTDSMDVIMRSELWAANKYLNEQYPTVDSLNAQLKKQYGSNSGVQISDSKVQADVAFATGGCIRKNPSGGGDIYMKDLLNLFKYANTVMAEPIKGEQLKAILEYNASDRLNVTTKDGKNSVELKGDKYTYVLTYGLDFYYDMSKPVGERVVINGFTNGKSFDPNAYYMVATTNYLCDNSANPTLSPLTSANNLLNNIKDEGLVIDMLKDYCTNVQGKDGLVYRTQNADKNGIQTSKWEIKCP